MVLQVQCIITIRYRRPELRGTETSREAVLSKRRGTILRYHPMQCPARPFFPSSNACSYFRYHSMQRLLSFAPSKSLLFSSQVRSAAQTALIAVLSESPDAMAAVGVVMDTVRLPESSIFGAEHPHRINHPGQIGQDASAAAAAAARQTDWPSRMVKVVAKWVSTALSVWR